MINSKKEAIDCLQTIKRLVHKVTFDANFPAGAITTYLEMIDDVQLFIDPELNLNEL